MPTAVFGITAKDETKVTPMEIYRFLKTAVLAAVLIAVLTGLSGCREHERRKVIIREEQREGEVTDVAPGEMIVE